MIGNTISAKKNNKYTRKGNLLRQANINQSWFTKESKLNFYQKKNVKTLLKKKGIDITKEQLNHLTERDALKLIK